LPVRAISLVENEEAMTDLELRAEKVASEYLEWLDRMDPSLDADIDKLRDAFFAFTRAEIDRELGELEHFTRCIEELDGDCPPHILKVMVEAGPVKNARAAVVTTKREMLEEIARRRAALKEPGHG
jgi:hypothetical protein